MGKEPGLALGGVRRQTGHSPSAGALFPTLSLLIPCLSLERALSAQ